MIKIYVDDFVTGYLSESWRDVMENISDYCHAVSTDVEIYHMHPGHYMYIAHASQTFPNVVYIDYLAISHNAANLDVMFPDLTEVGLFSFYGYIINFGKLKKIDDFSGNYLAMPRISLGDNRYRFTNKETGEQWDIKINEI